MNHKHLTSILKYCLLPGETFYSHKEIEKIISVRYKYNLGVRVNSKIIQKLGPTVVRKKIRGKTYAGFMLTINIKNVPVELLTITPADPVDELLHKKIRFLIKDWQLLPFEVQLQFKAHKDNYIKAIQNNNMSSLDDVKWAHELTELVPAPYPGKDVDFIIEPSKTIIMRLRRDNIIKNNNWMEPSKVYDLLIPLGFVRINEYVFGHLMFKHDNNSLPDW